MMLSVALLAACSGDAGFELFVDVRTDFVAGREFDRAQVSLVDARDVVRGQTASVPITDAFVRGARLAEFADVPPGPYLVTIELLAPDGRRLTERSTQIDIGEDTAVTVSMARSCIGVVCPVDEGDPRTQCLGGRCVEPRCGENDLASCGEPECITGADCEPGAACATPTCVYGVCLLAYDADSCVEPLWCHPTAGCTGPTVGDDASVGDASLGDAGPPDAGADVGPDAGCGDCNDFDICTRDACVEATCVHTPASDGTDCGGGQTCLDGVCT